MGVPITQAFMNAEGWSAGTTIYAQFLVRDAGTLPGMVVRTEAALFTVCP